MNRFFAENIEENLAVLEKDESYHLAMVLRMQVGERIEIVHGGRLYDAKITDNDKKAAKAELMGEKEVKSEPDLKVTLFQALPKGSKIDFVVQKCTELGIYKIVPVLTKRCVAKGKDSKTERLNRIAFEACKQCKRVAVPGVYDCTDLRQVDFSDYDLVLVAYEEEEATSIGDVLKKTAKPQKAGIIIGPEGGFEREETEWLKSKGVKCVSLGKRILRSETAGMAALSVLLYHYGEMEV